MSQWNKRREVERGLSESGEKEKIGSSSSGALPTDIGGHVSPHIPIPGAVY